MLRYVGRLELKPKKRALVVAPDYKLSEAYPHIDLQVILRNRRDHSKKSP